MPVQEMISHRPKPPIYIFDLDGTLADATHRLPLLENKSDPDRWDKFYELCHLDLPRWPVINTYLTLANSPVDLQIWSGRSERVRHKTRGWIQKMGIYPETLLMRPIGDHCPDHELKQRWLDALSPDDRSSLVAVFEDRTQVVDMWRRNGISCFQVAPGDF